MSQPGVFPDATVADTVAHPLAGALRRSLARPLAAPSAEADALLDAAGRCFSRRGVDHTSVPDIARAAGVSRATVYRLLGPVEDIAPLLLARDLDRTLAALPPELADAGGPGPIVDIASAVLRAVIDHPVTGKVRRDEPYLFGALLPQLGTLLAAGREALVPVLADGIAEGELRSADPEDMADVITRLMLVGLLVPPDDVHVHLRRVLLPLLDPST